MLSFKKRSKNIKYKNKEHIETKNLYREVLKQNIIIQGYENMFCYL